MKKAITILLILLFTLSVTACKDTTNEIPHFGLTESDYEGFVYLSKEMLNEEVLTYLITSDKNSVGTTQAHSENLGVELDVVLKPNNEESITQLFETMQQDFTAQCVSIGETQRAQDGATMWVTGNVISQDNDTYTISQVTQVLFELDENFYAGITITIHPQTVTEETTLLLEELNTFYQVTVAFDAQQLQQQLEEYTKKEMPQTTAFSNETFSFELPSNWQEARGAYWPDASTGNSAVLINRYEIGQTQVSLLKSMPFTQQSIQQIVPLIINLMDLDVTVTNVTGDSAANQLGEGFFCEAAVNLEGTQGNGIVYLIFGEEGYVYYFAGFATEGTEEVIRDGLQTAFMTAQFS